MSERQIPTPPDPHYNPASQGSLLKNPTNHGTKVKLDRFVWFANQNPSTASVRDADRVYYARIVQQRLCE